MIWVYCHTPNNYYVFIMHAVVSILLKALPQCNDAVEGVLKHNFSTSPSPYLFSHSYWVKLLNGPHKYLPVNIKLIRLKAKKIRLKAGQVHACPSITFPFAFWNLPDNQMVMPLEIPNPEPIGDQSRMGYKGNTKFREHCSPIAGLIGHCMRILKHVQCVLDLLVSLCPNGKKKKKAV